MSATSERPCDQQIVFWFVDDGFTMHEIGQLCGGITRQRVKQILARNGVAGPDGRMARRRRRAYELDKLIDERRRNPDGTRDNS